MSASSLGMAAVLAQSIAAALMAATVLERPSRHIAAAMASALLRTVVALQGTIAPRAPPKNIKNNVGKYPKVDLRFEGFLSA